MGRSTRLHGRAPALFRPSAPRPAGRADTDAGGREDEKALAYGFFAIGFFVLGGGGYLGRLFSGWGLGLHFALAALAFLLCRRHLRDA